MVKKMCLQSPYTLNIQDQELLVEPSQMGAKEVTTTYNYDVASKDHTVNNTVPTIKEHDIPVNLRMESSSLQDHYTLQDKSSDRFANSSGTGG